MKNMKLEEATMLALQGKLREVKGLRKLEGIRAIEEHEYEFDDYATIFKDLEMKTENKKKTEVEDDIMSFEDWVDFIDIKEDYPDWFEDKSELDRPFLDVINDHIDELNRDYRKYKRNQTKKEDIR